MGIFTLAYAAKSVDTVTSVAGAVFAPALIAIAPAAVSWSIGRGIWAGTPAAERSGSPEAFEASASRRRIGLAVLALGLFLQITGILFLCGVFTEEVVAVPIPVDVHNRTRNATVAPRRLSAT